MFVCTTMLEYNVLPVAPLVGHGLVQTIINNSYYNNNDSNSVATIIEPHPTNQVKSIVLKGVE